MPRSTSKVIDEGLFREGDRVEVNYKDDKWKPATLLRQHGDGNYRLRCDDGQELKRVKPHKLELLDDDDKDEDFLLYDDVEVYNKADDDWHAATVHGMNKKGTMFEVLYDGGGDVVTVDKKKLRHPEKKKGNKKALKQGDRVLVKPGDHEEEFPGTVERVDKDGSCHVKFDDKALGKESFVPRSHVRLMADKDGAPSLFVEGSKVQVRMNPGFMPPHFESGIVERIRGDKKCEVKLQNKFYHHKETYIAQVQHMRIAEPFQMLKSGRKVEVRVQNQGTTALVGGSSFVPGSVEWVHRDGSYTVRTTAARGAPALLCDKVPIEQIRIPGMAAGVPQTPLRSLLLFSANVGFEFLTFAAFLTCGFIEVSEGWHVYKHTGPVYTEVNGFVAQQVSLASPHLGAADQANVQACLAQRSTTTTNMLEGEGLKTSRNWLGCLLGFNAATLLLCLFLTIRFVLVRARMMQRERVDPHAFRRERPWRVGLAAAMLLSVLLSSAALVVYSSLLNSLRAECLYAPSGNFDLANDWQLHNPFEVRTAYHGLADSVTGIAGKSCCNLYRSLFLLIAVECANDLQRRVAYIIPALLSAVLVLVKLVSSIELLYYVQRYSFGEGRFGMNPVMDFACGNLVFAYWFGGLILASVVGAKSWKMLWEESRTGHHPTSTADGQARVEKARNGEFGPAAQREAEAAVLEEEVVRSSARYPATYALLFCSQWAVLHLVAAWFSLAANLHIRSYLDVQTRQQKDSIGAAAKGDWENWYNLDLAMAVYWVIHTTLVPLCMLLLRFIGPGVERPTHLLPMRY